MQTGVFGAARVHTVTWISTLRLYQQKKEEQEEAKKKKKRGKKLRHISGIFQLMMCGCGSTVERELLTVLSLFRSLRAPCCIPVCCAYFGNSCSAPLFSPFTVYSLCAALALFPPFSSSSRLKLLFRSSSPSQVFSWLWEVQ